MDSIRIIIPPLNFMDKERGSKTVSLDLELDMELELLTKIHKIATSKRKYPRLEDDAAAILRILDPLMDYTEFPTIPSKKPIPTKNYRLGTFIGIKSRRPNSRRSVMYFTQYISSRLYD